MMQREKRKQRDIPRKRAVELARVCARVEAKEIEPEEVANRCGEEESAGNREGAGDHGGIL
jgi:hypothetical protein